jgi:hypothetical protein
MSHYFNNIEYILKVCFIIQACFLWLKAKMYIFIYRIKKVRHEPWISRYDYQPFTTQSDVRFKMKKKDPSYQTVIWYIPIINKSSSKPVIYGVA